MHLCSPRLHFWQKTGLKLLLSCSVLWGKIIYPWVNIRQKVMAFYCVQPPSVYYLHLADVLLNVDSFLLGGDRAASSIQNPGWFPFASPDFPHGHHRVHRCHEEASCSHTSGLLLLLLSHFSRVRLSATPSTAAHQAPPSLGFSRQEHWSGLPFPSPMQESEK